jgi:O-acetyl-ADP-ribose deacetylase (regulator of RNase III)
MREAKIGSTTLRLLEGDITRQPADAIVNAANERLAGGGGVDGAIHRVGGPTIMEECQKFGHCPTGEAVVTGAGRLPARHVIHAVGPIWGGGRSREEALLASAYAACLIKATELGLKSIVFPSLSTGAYGYPLDLAARVALRTVVDRLRVAPGKLQTVSFALWGRDAMRAYEQALSAVLGGAGSGRR